jgi:hypothetical protein
MLHPASSSSREKSPSRLLSAPLFKGGLRVALFT